MEKWRSPSKADLAGLGSVVNAESALDRSDGWFAVELEGKNAKRTTPGILTWPADSNSDTTSIKLTSIPQQANAATFQLVRQANRRHEKLLLHGTTREPSTQ